LTDQAALSRIINAAELSKEDSAIEIGTGTGILTKELSVHVKNVITFEVDKKIIEVSKEYLSGCNNVTIINEDFLEANPLSFLPLNKGEMSEGQKGYKIVANVPYYITSPIIEKIIEDKICVSIAVLTVQREFAERIVAKPGTKDYGSFSIFVNYYCEPEIVSYIPKSSFLPQPDVGSAIIKLKFRKEPPVKVKSEEIFFKAVRASFGQRRKTLRNALQAKFEVSDIDKALALSGIDPKRRGETLAIQEFANLSNAIC
jgi:16S rRNA (adenine1518-N6/adenine1519-N6)-dimethyltransferase